MKIRVLLILALALAVAQTSFGDISTANNGSISSCANLSSSPTNVDGTLYNQFGCSLYNDFSSYTINLTNVMTQGDANIYDNLVVPGYVVVIDGDPNTLGDTGLFNESLWVAVLFWPGDQDESSASDSLTVYWPGAFPQVSDVQNSDDYFFIESTGLDTVYQPGGLNGGNVYAVILTPEPGAMLLLSCFLAMLGVMMGGVALRRRRGAR